jgi:hypothetical protein
MNVRTKILQLLNRSAESLARGTARFDYATQWQPIGQRIWHISTRRYVLTDNRMWLAITLDLWAYTICIDIALLSRVAAARQGNDIPEGAI